MKHCHCWKERFFFSHWKLNSFYFRVDANARRDDLSWKFGKSHAPCIEVRRESYYSIIGMNVDNVFEKLVISPVDIPKTALRKNWFRITGIHSEMKAVKFKFLNRIVFSSRRQIGLSYVIICIGFTLAILSAIGCQGWPLYCGGNWCLRLVWWGIKHEKCVVMVAIHISTKLQHKLLRACNFCG